jgi:dCTP deaminase
MAALGKKALLDHLWKGELVVSPILSEDQVGGSSIDLRMGTVVLMARAGRLSHVDPAAYRTAQDHKVIESKKQKHERFDVPFKESFLLHLRAVS